MIQAIFAWSRQQEQTKVNTVIKLNEAANETYLIPRLLTTRNESDSKSRVCERYHRKR